MVRGLQNRTAVKARGSVRDVSVSTGRSGVPPVKNARVGTDGHSTHTARKSGVPTSAAWVPFPGFHSTARRPVLGCSCSAVQQRGTPQ